MCYLPSLSFRRHSNLSSAFFVKLQYFCFLVCSVVIKVGSDTWLPLIPKIFVIISVFTSREWGWHRARTDLGLGLLMGFAFWGVWRCRISLSVL